MNLFKHSVAVNVRKNNNFLNVTACTNQCFGGSPAGNRNIKRANIELAHKCPEIASLTYIQRSCGGHYVLQATSVVLSMVHAARRERH